MAIETPFAIHGEYVSSKAVDQCLEFFNNNKSLHVKGQIGKKGNIDKTRKDCTELPIDLNKLNVIEIWVKELASIVNNYVKKFPILGNYAQWGFVDGVNIQNYKPGEGYFKLHSERMTMTNSNRVIAFMTYLTDTPNAGTHFEYHNWSAPCEKGLTLLWPTDYAYAHKGDISNTKDKTIITGWFGFRDGN